MVGFALYVLYVLSRIAKKVLMLWYKISAMYGMAAALISISLFSFQFLVQYLSENIKNVLNKILKLSKKKNFKKPHIISKKFNIYKGNCFLQAKNNSFIEKGNF